MRYEDKFLLRILIIIFAMLIYPDVYTIFLPLTKYLSTIILSLLYNVEVIENSILVNSQTFSFISACIALPAYYLLFFLILGTKDLTLNKSAKLFFIGSILIIAMNIIRIDLLIIAFLEFGKRWFDSIHLFFWKFVSGIYVALVWIFLTRRYKVKTIPFYDDLKYFYSRSMFQKTKLSN